MPISVADIQPLILAGGLGTRLRNVAPDTAKPMISVNGRPFVEWIVRWLAAAGFRSATISTCYKAEQFEQHFARQPVDGIDVKCLREPEQLGTGGAIRYVVSRSTIQPAAWLVLNGDSLVICDLDQLREFFADDGTIVSRHVEDAGRYGRLEVSTDGRLLAFHEKNAEVGGAGQINGGIYLLRSSLLLSIENTQPLSMEYNVLPEWLREGRKLSVLDTDGDFIDIGTEQTLRDADAFIQKNIGRFA